MPDSVKEPYPPSGHLFWGYLPYHEILYGHDDKDSAQLRMDGLEEPLRLTTLPRATYGGKVGTDRVDEAWGAIRSERHPPVCDRTAEIQCWCPRPVPRQWIPDQARRENIVCKELSQARSVLRDYVADTSRAEVGYRMRRGAVLVRRREDRYVVLSSEKANMFRACNINQKRFTSVASGVLAQVTQVVTEHDSRRHICRVWRDSTSVAYGSAGKEIVRVELDTFGTFCLDRHDVWDAAEEFRDSTTGELLRIHGRILELVTEDVLQYLGGAAHAGGRHAD
jgi:hypothetical protein